MLWILLGIIAGLVLPVQTLVNTRLRASTGTPFSSSLISFAVGTMTLLVIATAVTGGEFGISRAFGEPLWVWFGGLLGVAFGAVLVALGFNRGHQIIPSR